MGSEQPTHVTDLIEAYLAGGLTPDERASFESHIESCGACAKVLAAARDTDAGLGNLFHDAKPDAGFKDRVIKQLRGAPGRRWPVINPAVRRTAVGIAATVALASAGVMVSKAVDGAG